MADQTKLVIMNIMFVDGCNALSIRTRVRQGAKTVHHEVNAKDIRDTAKAGLLSFLKDMKKDIDGAMDAAASDEPQIHGWLPPTEEEKKKSKKSWIKNPFKK